MASTTRTPGITGCSGKWPTKKGSLAETFFSPTIRRPGSNSRIRSTSRIGYRWGSRDMISSMSMVPGVRSTASPPLCLQGPRQRDVEAVAGPHRDKDAGDPGAQQREISQQVHHLVARRLDRLLVGLPVGVVGGRHVARARRPDRHDTGDREPPGGQRHDAPLPLLHPAGRAHPEEPPGEPLRPEARLPDRLHDGEGAAVEPGELLSRDLHLEVVDAEGPGGGEQVFHHPDPPGTAQGHAGGAPRHHVEGRRDRRALGVRPPEADPRALGRGPEPHLGRPARVEGDPPQRDRAGEGVLVPRVPAGPHGPRRLRSSTHRRSSGSLRSAAWARQCSMRGRAGRPQTTAPGGTSRVTPLSAMITASSPIVRWSAIPDMPPMRTRCPIRTLPATKTAAAMATSSPTWTLWRMWTKLSSFVPRPIRVAPSVARSTVELAPISTSSPITTVPTWGMGTWRRLASWAYPKPSLPITTPDWRTTRAPRAQPRRTVTRGCRTESGPIRTPCSMTPWAWTWTRSPSTTSSPTTT